MLCVTNGETMVDAKGREGGAISGEVSDWVDADSESDGMGYELKKECAGFCGAVCGA